jgi:hypothetical protein
MKSLEFRKLMDLINNLDNNLRRFTLDEIHKEIIKIKTFIINNKYILD